ncbi:MAG: hypothetical protein AAF752_05755, partial [Bacteroidota bacterium]
MRFFPLALLLTAVPAVAQTVETGFEADVSRYQWTATVGLQESVGPWQIEVRNEFMSEVFRLNERLGEFRDENRARWRIGRPVGGNLLATAYGYADSFSQNQAAEVAGFVGVRLPVRDLGWVEPAVGFVLDRRLGALSVEGSTETQTDTGPAVGFRALARSRLAPNLQATLGLESAWQWINPRQGRTVVARGAVQRVDEASRLVVDV